MTHEANPNEVLFNEHIIKNCFFTITTDFLKTNYRTLPIQHLKVLLIKTGDDWSLPSWNFNHQTSVQSFFESIFNTNILDNSFITDEFSTHFSNNTICSTYISILRKEILDCICLDDSLESALFSLEECQKLNLDTDTEHILIGTSSDSSPFYQNAFNYIEDKALNTLSFSKFFLPEEFTIAELMLVASICSPNFETFRSNFSISLTDSKSKSGMLLECLDEQGKKKKSTKFSRRPAQLYKFNNDFIPKKNSIFY